MQQRTFVRSVVWSMMLAAPAVAQTSFAASAKQVATGKVDNVTIKVYDHYRAGDVRPDAHSLTLSWPKALAFVNADRTSDGRYKLFLKGPVNTGNLFDYYRRLLAAQGYQLVAAENDADDEAFWPWENDFDAQHVSATFVRRAGTPPLVLNEVGTYDYPSTYAGAFPGDRVDLLVDRESANTVAVYVDPSTPAGTYGVYDQPLYAGVYDNVPYELYGPIGYPGYQHLPDGSTRVRLVAPEGAQSFRVTHLSGDEFVYRFDSKQELERIADLYDRVLTDQGFKKVTGTFKPGLRTVTYAKGDHQLGLRIHAVATNQYQVRVDLNPQA